MNKIFKVIWNEARNAYVVVSEIAKNHGSKSCSTKKLLAMLIATGVMTCASFDVLAEQPAAEKTAAQQYVALKAKEFDRRPLPGTADRKEYDAQTDGKKKIGDYTYRYDRTNKYWVREGYVLTVDKNGGKYTPLSANQISADVAYKDGVAEGILQSVTSTVSASGTVTNMGESLNKITASSFAGVSHACGTEVEGPWDYIIKDASWEGKVASSNYKDGYVNLCAGETATAPKGFVNTDSKDLIWDDSRQAYFYKNQRVDYSNMYVINGKLGVFTNADSTKVYTGTVYGKNNEILMTVKDKDNNFYSYWAAEVTDPSATMATYRVEEYNKNLAKLVENDDALNRNDIKEVTLTNDENSATIGLLRNGDKAVDGAITVTSGGGTGGSGAAHDTFVKISNGTTEQTFATGSKVEAIVDNGATTGIKINGQDYTIKSGSKVSVTQTSDKKTTTITVDGTETTITDTDTHNALKSASLSGKTLKITGEDKDSVEVDLSSIDTDTKYTAGNGIAIDENNGNAISVKLKEGENNLEVTEAGLALKQDLTVNRVAAGNFYMSTAGIGYGDKAYITSSGLNANSQKITGVAEGTISEDSTDAVNGSQLHAVKKTANKGWNLSTGKGEAVNVAPGETVDFSGDKNIKVSNTGKAVKVELNKELTGLTSVTTKNAYVTNVDASNNKSVTNVEYVKKQIAGVTLTEGKGISITDKKINVKLKDGEENLKVDETGLYLRKNLTEMESITGVGDGKISFATGGNVTINNITFNNDGRIQNVANGTENTDAVNVSQLNKVSAAAKTEVVKGTNIASVVASNATDDGHTVYTVNAKGTSVSVDGNFNLNTTTDDETNVTNYGISLKDSVTIGGTHAVTINGTDGTVTGLTNTTWNKDSITSGRAATEDQLQAVATEAGKHTTLSNGKNTTVESTVKDGQTDYKVNVAGDLTDITSVANGDSKINLNKDSIIISNGNKYFAITNSGIGMSYIGADYSAKSIMLGENGTTISGGLSVAGSKITGVAAGVADTDAVNVGQLNAAVQAGNTDTHIKAGEYGVGTDNKVNMQLVDKNGKDAGTVTITDVAKASDVGDVNNIASDIKNKEGKTTVVDAVNNLNNKLDTKVGDLQYSKVEKGDIADGDSTTTAIGKLDQKLTDVAATAAKHTKVEGSKNITVNNTAKEGEAANYKVELNNDIDVNTVKANSVTTGQTVMNKDGLKVGDKVSVSATVVTAGQTSISDEGLAVGPNTSLKADELKVDGKTYIDKNGLNANGMQITNVADGKENSDAVNVGQLKESEKTINNRINGVENQVISNSNRINQLGNRVNKVGAGAAALAALHPMDFDPDDKLTFSAGYGNYGGENAAAIGAYYRPDEKVMFSVAGTVGNGENMVNAGISFALDRTNHVSNSRTALAREVIDLRGQLAVMGAKMAKMEKALGMLDETKTKLFPDVPANHWAYEYIAKLAGNGYIEGYPDGNFGGDRLMTRYEFAAMLYRAIENGAALEEKIIKEFEPELGRIRVDRISGEDGDRDKIERVRVNDTKGERDHYGNKLAK